MKGLNRRQGLGEESIRGSPARSRIIVYKEGNTRIRKDDVVTERSPTGRLFVVRGRKAIILLKNYGCQLSHQKSSMRN